MKPVMYVVIQGALSQDASWCTTSIVIDFGHEDTYTVPISEGYN